MVMIMTLLIYQPLSQLLSLFLIYIFHLLAPLNLRNVTTNDFICLAALLHKMSRTVNIRN